MKLNSNDPLTAKQLQIRVLLFFVGYICCLEFGNILTLSAEGFASFWPASGLFLAILLLTAKRYWLLLILTVFPAHILNGIFHQQSTVASLVHAVGGSLEAAVGAYMLRRLFSRKVQLTSSVLSMLWVIAAFVFAASINATLYTIIGTQSSNSFIEVWLQKLASDIVGMISVTPLIVAWSKPSKGLVKKQGYAALAELIILSVLSFATWFVIFSGIGGKAISQKYIAICFLFIAALRLTPKMFTFFGFVFAILAFYFGQTSASYEAWDVILIENRVVSIQIFVILSLLLSNQFRFLEQQRQSLLALESESESERKFAVVFQQAPLLMALSQIEDGSLLDVNNRFCEALGYTREELLNKTATEIGIISSEDRDRLAVEYSNLGRVSAVECKITRKNRTTIDCLVTAEEIRIGGVPRLLTIADDITDQKRTELELRRHSENLTLLIQASQSINQTLQLNEIYNAVHAFVQSILKFDAFVLSTFNPDTEKIRCVAAWSDGKQKSVSSVPEIPLAPEGTGIVSKVIRSGRAQLIKDYDKQFKDTKVKYIIAPDSDKVSTSSEGTQPAQTAIIVPIKNDDGVSGVIQVLSTEPNAYTQSQMNLIEAFALQVGLAIKNAQLYQASQNEIALRTWVESELRSSEERFRSMAEQLVDMLYQTDEKGVITYVSPSSLRIFGWLPEEMINHQFTEFLAEDQIPIATQAFQCAISTGKSASKLELLMRRKDGTVFQGELNAAMLFLDRKIVGTQGLIRDVTERKQVEEELWESKERYRAISEYSHNAICIIDEFAKILWVNDEMVKVGGYSREEIQHASSFADFVAPESLEFVVTNFQKVFRDEPYEHHYTFTIIRKDGVKRLCEKHMVDIKDNKGKRVLVISMLDVTEQKHAEVALKEVTQRLRLATVSSRMGVWDWNIPTGELIWDDRMYEIYGVDRSTFTCNFAEIVKLVHPEDIEQQYRASEDVKAGRREYDTEFRIVLNDGSIKYIKANAVIILDNDNKPWRMVGVNRDITELKLAEIELRERERKWATLISNLPGFVYRCANDPNWTMDYISIGCREVTGYEPEDFFNNRKLSYNDIVDPQYQEPLWNKWQQVLSRRESFEGEYQIITANGETRWVWERGQGIFDENGNLLWLEGFITDITERKRAETALIESEAQFRRIVETANEGIWVMDRSCKTTFVNSRMLEMLGCSMEILMENPIDFFMFKEDIEEHAEMMESREAGTSSIYERRFKRSDGTTLWTIVSAAPIVSATGEYVGSFGMFTDITERKKTEEKYQTLFNTMLDGFASHEIICNSRGDPVDYRFLSVNPAFEKLTGIVAADVIGKTVLEVFPDTEPMWIEVYGKVALTGEPIHFENFTKALNRYYEVSAFQPSPNQFACIVKDITSRTIAEEERAKLVEQIQQAQKMESVGRLAGGVAHDLNNLLTPVLGYSELLLNEKIADEIRKGAVEQIINAGQRAKELVRQLLAFSRKQTMEFKPTFMNNVVKDFQKLLRRTIREDIAFETILAPSIPPVKADVGQLEQVIMNLVVNAQDAMQNGGKLIVEVSHCKLDEAFTMNHEGVEPGEYVQLSVSDSGHGMDTETLSHIFEPFFTTKEVGKGTGLGLSTVYGIVKQHNGSILVQSEPGKGTKFLIFIPVTQEAPTSKTETMQSALELLHGDETILLVEDDENVRKLALTILERQGYQVTVATNGIEALEVLALKGETIQLLLTDIVMPKMNGRDLYERAVQMYPHLKVLYMSGYTRDIITHHGVVEEDFQFIQKPFTIRALVTKVRNELDRVV